MAVLFGSANTAVKIKGYGDGFLLSVDPKASEDHILKATIRIFRQLRNLAAGALVQVDAGSWSGSALWADRLALVLQDRFAVSGVLPYGEPPESQGAEMIATPSVLETQVLTGRVRSGQRVNSERHLVVLGDVNPGGEVVAGGDIYVMGSLRGTAVAGNPSDSSSIVMALDFRPMQLQVGPHVADHHVPAKPGRVEYAFVAAGRVVVADYLDENPFAKAPVLTWRT
ncbi:septum site-determining protein MinC [Desulfoluna sp.]|uniref:septum site-determining protein MinC n=1 Tax=Desulfoluna sp. TaxID=2045199 RepID=UPI002614BC25|nr:septum site-determining protein MinC [Desulfoluna sp.]